MEIVEVIGRTVVKMWTTEFDDKAREQIENLASLPFVHHYIALMPDCHGGMGMTTDKGCDYSQCCRR